MTSEKEIEKAWKAYDEAIDEEVEKNNEEC